MAQETCIFHRPGERYVQLREDYIDLMQGDHCAAALLALLEYWANGTLSKGEHSRERIPLGERSLKDFSTGLMDLYSPKRIGERIQTFINRQWLETRLLYSNRKNREYFVNVALIQAELSKVVMLKLRGQMTVDEQAVMRHLSDEKGGSRGQMTDDITGQMSDINKVINQESNSLSNPPVVPQGTNNGGEPEIEILPPEGESNNAPIVPVTNNIDPVNQSSGAAVATTKAGKYDALRELYNDHKPTHWAKCLKLDDKREKKLAALHKIHKTELAALLVDALAYATSDRWWCGRDKDFSIDTLLRDNRVMEFAEKHRAKEGKAQTTKGNYTHEDVAEMQSMYDNIADL